MSLVAIIYDGVYISTFMLIGPNAKGKESLSIRFANKGNNILDAVASIQLYEFSNGERKERKLLFDHTKEYHTVLNKTTLLLRLDLTKNAQRSGLWEKITEGLNNLSTNKGGEYKDIIQFVFSFKGIDEKTGDFVGMSKVFTEQNIRFGDGFEKVVGWNGINPLKREKPKWDLFNSIVREVNYSEYIKNRTIKEHLS